MRRRTVSTLIRENPSVKGKILKAVSATIDEISYDQAIAIVDEMSVPKTCTISSQSVVAMLVANGILKQSIYVDGAVYEGSPEDFFNDTTISVDAEISYTLQSSPDACHDIESFASRGQIRALLAINPEQRNTFLKVLDACTSLDGMTKKQIDGLLADDDEALKFDVRTGLPTVFSAYYLNALEEVGALVWDGVWRTTETGKEFCQA